MKKNLFVLTGPYCMLQFLWYYCNYKNEKIIWDVVVLCQGRKEANPHLIEKCKQLGIFDSIYLNDDSIFTKRLSIKIKFFISMLGHWLLGRKKLFANKYINSIVDSATYDTVVLPNESSLLAGCYMLLNKQNIVLLEDGMVDYISRKKWCGLRNILNVEDVISMCIAFMGYSNLNLQYHLKTTRNCIKYSSVPDNLKYKKFKEIYTLFDQNVIDVKKYNYMIMKTFPVEDIEILKKAKIVIFTAPLNPDFIQDNSCYLSFIKWISEKYSNELIVIKKHPRDKFDYQIENNNIVFVNASLPAEVMIPLLECRDIYLLYTSTLIIQLIQKKMNFKIFWFQNIKNNLYIQNFKDISRQFGISKENLVKLE